MLRKLVLFFLLISTSIAGQTFQGTIIDSESTLPITYANVTFLKSDKGTYSDENGQFKMEVDTTESLLISSIGYHNRIIQISAYNLATYNHIIELKPSIEKLEEVVLTSKKIKYSSIKSLGDKRRGVKLKTGLPFGYEFANYIKNPFRKKGILETLSIFLSKNKEYDYLATYNFKFYAYDVTNKRPGKLLHFENLIVEPLNKSYELKVDVSDLNIEFPVNGICIGVEILNTKYKEPLKSMAYMAPLINFTHTEQKINSWGRYRSKDWTIKTRKSRIRKDFNNARINIKAKIEK